MAPWLGDTVHSAVRCAVQPQGGKYEGWGKKGAFNKMRGGSDAAAALAAALGSSGNEMAQPSPADRAQYAAGPQSHVRLLRTTNTCRQAGSGRWALPVSMHSPSTAARGKGAEASSQGAKDVRCHHATVCFCLFGTAANAGAASATRSAAAQLAAFQKLCTAAQDKAAPIVWAEGQRRGRGGGQPPRPARPGPQQPSQNSSTSQSAHTQWSTTAHLPMHTRRAQGTRSSQEGKTGGSKLFSHKSQKMLPTACAACPRVCVYCDGTVGANLDPNAAAPAHLGAGSRGQVRTGASPQQRRLFKRCRVCAQ